MSVTYSDVLDGSTIEVSQQTMRDRVRIASGRTSLTTEEEAQIDQLVDDALLIIKNHYGGTLDGIDPEMLAYVLTEVVTARFTDPGPRVTQEEVSVDDARTLTRYDAAGAGFVFTDAMWALLRPDTVRERRSSFSVSPSYAPDVRWRRRDW